MRDSISRDHQIDVYRYVNEQGDNMFIAQLTIANDVGRIVLNNASIKWQEKLNGEFTEHWSK